MSAPSPSVWNTHPFGNQNRLSIPLGALTLRFARRGEDLLVREVRGKNGEASSDAFDEISSRRYSFNEPVESVELAPRTPARPLVVRPRQTLMLGPGSRVSFYVSFPVDVVLITRAAGRTTQIERIPSEELSDTWFGDSLEGVFCYSLKSRARRDRDEVQARATTRAICTLDIRNESLEPLKCEKFCLRLEHCRLWIDDSGLWTSPVQIRYRGTANLSAIDYGDGPPDQTGASQLIAEAEVPPQRGLLRRTFGYTGLQSFGF